jgi:hypothetical protein
MLLALLWLSILVLSLTLLVLLTGRTGNLITLPDHPVWQVKDANTMYTVFEQAFPQVCRINMSFRSVLLHTEC